MSKRFSPQSGNTILLLNYIGRGLSALNYFWLFPKILGLKQLGLYMGVHHIIFLLARLNIGQGVLRYGAALQEKPQRRAVFLAWIAGVTTLFYLILIAPFFAFKVTLLEQLTPKAPEVANYLPLIFFQAYLVLISIVLKDFYIALGNVFWPSVSQHILLNLMLIATISLYGLDVLSFHQLLWATTTHYLIHLVLLIFNLYRQGELHLGWDQTFLNKQFAKTFLTYSLFTLLLSSMAMLMLRIDNVMVLGLCGKKAEGIFHTIAFLVLLLEIPMKAVKQTTTPEVVQLLEKKDYARLGILYKKVTSYQFALTSLFFLLFYLYLDYILFAFPPDAIKLMKSLFLLLGLGKLLDNICRMGSEILLLSPYFMWTAFSVLWLFFGIIGNYYMIKWMDMYGASIATIITLLIGGTFSCGVLMHKIGIHPFSLQLLTWITITLLTAAGLTYLPTLHSAYLDILMRTSLVLGCYGLGYLSLKRKKATPA